MKKLRNFIIELEPNQMLSFEKSRLTDSIMVTLWNDNLKVTTVVTKELLKDGIMGEEFLTDQLYKMKTKLQ